MYKYAFERILFGGESGTIQKATPPGLSFDKWALGFQFGNLRVPAFARCLTCYIGSFIFYIVLCSCDYSGVQVP